MHIFIFIKTLALLVDFFQDYREKSGYVLLVNLKGSGLIGNVCRSVLIPQDRSALRLSSASSKKKNAQMDD